MPSTVLDMSKGLCTAGCVCVGMCVGVSLNLCHCCVILCKTKCLFNATSFKFKGFGVFTKKVWLV